MNRGSRARRLSVAIYARLGGSRLTKSPTKRVRTGSWSRISLPSTRVVQGKSYRLVVTGTAGKLKISSSSQTKSCKRAANAKLAVSARASARTAALAVNCTLPAYIAGTRKEFKRTAAPSLLTAPVVSGSTKVGARLSASRGQWSGSPTSYAYSWKDCDSSGTDCSKISGAQSSTYTLKNSDLGATVVAVVAAMNKGGTTNGNSQPTAVVTLNGTTGTGSSGSTTTTATTPSTTTSTTTPTTTSTTSTTPTTTTSTTPTTTTSTTSTSTTSTTSTTTSTTSTTPTTGVTFTAVGGGSSYFANLDPESSWLDTVIPVGGWMEQPQSAGEVAEDKAMGENIYWNLAGTPGSDVVNYSVIRAGGMHVAAPSENSTTGSETVAWQGGDENDLNYGPGSASWNSSTGACASSSVKCGYTVSNWYYSDSLSTTSSAGATTGTGTVTGSAKLPYTPDGRAVNQGFGKGVLFFESDTQAAQFLKYSDILSADAYWLTDNSLASQGTACEISPATSASTAACGNWGGPGFTTAQAALPANYGWNVQRLNYLQSLNGSSKPVVMDVETGCPFTGSSAGDCATPPETIASAWHALIAGARGIVWFQHNFSGPCEDDRTLLDGSNSSSSMYNCQQTPGVTLHDLVTDLTGFDDEVQALTPVLLSPTANGYVSTSADVSTMAKSYGGKCYVFAGSGTPFTPPASNLSASFKLADGYTGPVTVYDENRTVQATSGSFSDTFADENAVHIYVVPSSGC